MDRKLVESLSLSLFFSLVLSLSLTHSLARSLAHSLSLSPVLPSLFVFLEVDSASLAPRENGIRNQVKTNESQERDGCKQHDNVPPYQSLPLLLTFLFVPLASLDQNLEELEGGRLLVRSVGVDSSSLLAPPRSEAWRPAKRSFSSSSVLYSSSVSVSCTRISWTGPASPSCTLKMLNQKVSSSLNGRHGSSPLVICKLSTAEITGSSAGKRASLVAWYKPCRSL